MKKILLPLMILAVTACSHTQQPIELIAETNPSRISPDKDKKTPAMRLGFAKGKASLEDIIYF
jgi:hypothetical protein|tara:strand:- start:16510 stop:16698 length:189 start_codon:yes stop_codon:yes gene_type:complete